MDGQMDNGWMGELMSFAGLISKANNCSVTRDQSVLKVG